MDIMQLGGRFQTFSSEHPKFVEFLRDAGQDAMREGSVLECKVVSPEGKEYVTNIRLTANDIETINLIRSMRSGGV